MKKKQKNKGGGAILKIFIVLLALSSASVYVYYRAMVRYYPLEYAEEIVCASERYGVSVADICAVIHTESGFAPDAVSSRGAVGLMQIMPDTFIWLADKRGATVTEDMLLDPYTNIDYGVYYIAYLRDILGDMQLVHAAYNAGINRVREWLANPEYSEDGASLTNIPFKETRGYLEKISTAKEHYLRLYDLDQ